MKVIIITVFLAFVFVSVFGQEEKDDKPSIELVFCLDATGSMSGLIHTAKEKIWDIVTVMTQAKPAPDIKLGMIFYRDLQDEFITKVYPLTENIDSIYAELLLINAEGGGDSPESVNQAVNEAVTKMKWTKGKKVYRTIFLVGDCPPHMDYQQDIKYSASCKLANENGIVINTIKLGFQCQDAIVHFKSIAEKTNGRYLQLGQHADDVVIHTVYDDSIRFYSAKIDASKIYYGSPELRESMTAKQEAALDLYETSSKNAIASRAKFSLSESGAKNFYGKNELIIEIIQDRVSLDDIETEELPEVMQKMNKKEQEEYVAKLKKERETNLASLLRLSKQREAFIAKETKTNPQKDSFSGEVFEIVKSQAAEKGVVFVK